MFILIIIQEFEDFHDNPTNPIQFFQDKVDIFKLAWGRFNLCSNSIYLIHSSKIIKFLTSLGPPLGLIKN